MPAENVGEKADAVQAGYTALSSPTANRAPQRNTSLDLENNRDDASEADELCDHE
jgi:hypothetical protein